MKPTVSRRFVTAAPPERVFDYLADFANAEEWDPGTKSCVRLDGDGGVGTTYRNVSVFLGRESEIVYTTTELERPTRLHFVGRNDQFEGHDVIGIRAAGTGSEVTYTAQFEFLGSARYAAPAVALYLPLLANRVIRQLRETLDSVGGPA